MLSNAAEIARVIVAELTLSARLVTSTMLTTEVSRSSVDTLSMALSLINLKHSRGYATDISLNNEKESYFSYAYK